MCQVLMNMLKVRKQQRFEEAVNFVLRNIRLGATIDGLVRKEKYELPPEAIREMIINAHCHRNFDWMNPAFRLRFMMIDWK